MTTIATLAPHREGVRLGKMRENLARDDWYPRYERDGLAYYRVLGCVFPNGETARLRPTRERRFQIVGHEDLGTFRRRDDAARNARAEALRTWAAWERGEQ